MAEVATAIITSGSTLAGVALTHRYTLRRSQDDRADNRRVEQRDAAAELLDAAERWSLSAGGVGTAIAGLRGDMGTLAGDTQVIDRHEEPQKAMGRAVARAKLIITDEIVTGAVAELAAIHAGTGQWFADLAEVAKGPAPRAEAFAMVARYGDVRKQAVAALERTAVQQFSAPAPGARRKRGGNQASGEGPRLSSQGGQ